MDFSDNVLMPTPVRVKLVNVSFQGFARDCLVITRNDEELAEIVAALQVTVETLNNNLNATNLAIDDIDRLRISIANLAEQIAAQADPIAAVQVEVETLNEQLNATGLTHDDINFLEVSIGELSRETFALKKRIKAQWALFAALEVNVETREFLMAATSRGGNLELA
ncbi:hypothetical protein MPSEU_000636000 [Mayamaea pseudoterrestris]|nr:hypothetical protein MPSEU_000636000 [Mayamaea pseudoterrestris]